MQHRIHLAYLIGALLCLTVALPAPPAHAAAVSNSPDLERWLKVDQANPADLQAYLDAYPRGMFARLARDKLQQAGRPAAPPPPPTAATTPVPPVRTVTPVAPPPPSRPAAALPAAIGGPPDLLGTATLRVQGQRVPLYGISGTDGPYLDHMRAYIDEQGGSVTCTPHDRRTYVCMLPSGIDLAEAVLANGAGRVLEGAPASYRRQQDDAQRLHLGIWAHW